MKEVVGKKSTGEFVLYLILFIIFTPLTIILFVFGYDEIKEPGIIFYMLPIILLVIFFYLIFIKKLPKDLIFIDEERLYVFQSGHYEEVLLKDIIIVTPRRANARSFSYTFGSIIIQHKDSNISVGHVADCENVCLTIMKRVKTLDQISD